MNKFEKAASFGSMMGKMAAFSVSSPTDYRLIGGVAGALAGGLGTAGYDWLMGTKKHKLRRALIGAGLGGLGGVGVGHLTSLIKPSTPEYSIPNTDTEPQPSLSQFKGHRLSKEDLEKIPDLRVQQNEYNLGMADRRRAKAEVILAMAKDNRDAVEDILARAKDNLNAAKNNRDKARDNYFEPFGKNPIGRFLFNPFRSRKAYDDAQQTYNNSNETYNDVQKTYNKINETYSDVRKTYNDAYRNYLEYMSEAKFPSLYNYKYQKAGPQLY